MKRKQNIVYLKIFIYSVQYTFKSVKNDEINESISYIKMNDNNI